MSLDFSLLSQRSEAIESQWTYRFVTLFQVVVRVTHGGRFEGLLCWGTQEERDRFLGPARDGNEEKQQCYSCLAVPFVPST